jgi:hypothetical protein
MILWFHPSGCGPWPVNQGCPSTRRVLDISYGRVRTRHRGRSQGECQRPRRPPMVAANYLARDFAHAPDAVSTGWRNRGRFQRLDAHHAAAEQVAELAWARVARSH